MIVGMGADQGRRFVLRAGVGVLAALGLVAILAMPRTASAPAAAAPSGAARAAAPVPIFRPPQPAPQRLAVADVPAPAPAARARRHFDACLGAASAECRQALTQALERTFPADAALAGMAGGSAEGENVPPLPFADDEPRWVQQIESLARDGLPLVRMPRGPDREVVIGISPDGVLGISLEDTTGE